MTTIHLVWTLLGTWFDKPHPLAHKRRAVLLTSYQSTVCMCTSQRRSGDHVETTVDKMTTENDLALEKSI